jgi:hypothetical protein
MMRVTNSVLERIACVRGIFGNVDETYGISLLLHADDA